MAESISSTDTLVGSAEVRLQQFIEAGGISLEQIREAGLYDELLRVWSISDYVADSCIRYPRLLNDLITCGDLLIPYDTRHYAGVLARLDFGDSEDALMSRLREFRRREMIRIIWRDLSGRSDYAGTTTNLSNLADACIAAALDRLYEVLCSEYGTPLGERSGERQQLMVLALGKLGGGELNLSSDVDLIFLYGEQGSVREEGRASEEVTNQEFFLRLARKLISVLSELRHDGFVFRVDMRLRPYGDSGSLVLPRAAMELYYEREGRDWERYAFIKARPVAGDMEGANAFLEWLSPFVYRKYLDYGAIESLRDMKRLINREVANKALEHDIKLGPGGIREIEFVVQSYQLIWGARDTRLRIQGLLRALGALEERRDLPSDTVTRLREAYLFLRDSEHVIQAESDRQTQLLPRGDLSRKRLAFAMGFADWDSYIVTLESHRNFVAECYDQVINPDQPEEEKSTESSQMWERVWQEIESRDLTQFFDDSGFTEGEETIRQLRRLKKERNRDPTRTVEVERIDRLVPAILDLVSRERNPSRTLGRVVSVIEGVLRRTTYFAFLLNNPHALERMIKLCGTSPWITDQLQKQPVLLSELGSESGNDEFPGKDELRAELTLQRRSSDADDLEEQMDLLRHFKNTHQMKAALLELSNLSPVMISSDRLTDLADVILENVLQIAWQYLVSRHGRPSREDGQWCDPDFAILAYGKQGGFELGYGSDLDLVFVHNGSMQGDTEGPRSIPNAAFFNRLGQRIIHILSSFTSTGVLYEIDVRLRPSGRKGLLVTSVDAFERYQQDKAWTWEHQALVRARYVAGDRSLGEHLEAIRREILGQPRDVSKVRSDIVEMRDKMRSLEKREDAPQAPAGRASPFDLKHAMGAIVDIEFMVQYAVLAWSHQYPQLCDYPDNYRILGLLEETGVFDKDDVKLLRSAYLAYRSAVHVQALGGQLFISAYSQLTPYREKVVNVWRKLMQNEG